MAWGDEFVKLENPKDYLIDEFEILKDKKYILYIGDRKGYKNFKIAVDVVRAMNDYSLVVVGGGDFNNDEKESLKYIKNKFYHYSGINGNKLNLLYNCAFCLLYPSNYEGFGIPIIEAMKAGCPVVSTNKSSIPEVAGDAGLLVDEIKVDSFINGIKKLEDNEFRNKVINKGLEQAKRYSWDKCFEETYSFYREIWNKKFGR